MNVTSHPTTDPLENLMSDSVTIFFDARNDREITGVLADCAPGDTDTLVESWDAAFRAEAKRYAAERGITVIIKDAVPAIRGLPNDDPDWWDRAAEANAGMEDEAERVWTTIQGDAGIPWRDAQGLA